MKLWGNPFCTEVEDHGHGGGVRGGETEIFALAAAGVPLWKLLTILKFGIEDVGRTAPGMKTAKVTKGAKTGTCPLLLRRQVIRAGKVIPDVDGMVEGKRPQLQVVGGRPGEGGVNEHGPSKVADDLDGAFCHSILMVGPNPGESDGLSLASEVVLELFGLEDAIVGEEGFDGDTKLVGLAFQDAFPHESVASSEGKLVVGEDLAGHVVNEDGAAHILVAGGRGMAR